MKGPKRITVIEKIRSEKKLIPAPNHYKNLEKHKKIVNGKFDKTTGLSFLSEVEFLAKTQPGPNQYQPNMNVFKTRSSAWKIVNPKTKEKTVKFKTPGVGTYNPQECVKFSSTMNNFSRQKYTFNKEVRATSTETEVRSYFKKIGKAKRPKSAMKASPGAGHYNYEPCYDKIVRKMKSYR